LQILPVIEDLSPLLKPMKRIIVIDDDPAFAETLARMLGSLGYAVTISTDARSSYTFDLTDDDIVFLDVPMPNTSGLQVLEQLAKQEAKCAIILMSGHLERLEGAEKYAESLNLNLIGALEKPFRISDVEDALAEAAPAKSPED
jgi:sigma-B regulation protein RsbU (phosphoserine phosphatase)